MVKIPNLDDLKKMGSDFVDSAKAGKLGSMVDKLKSGVGTKSTPGATPTDETVKLKFQEIYATLKELGDTRAVQAGLMKKVEDQLSELAKTIESMQKPPSASPDISQQSAQEDKKL